MNSTIAKAIITVPEATLRIEAASQDNPKTPMGGGASKTAAPDRSRMVPRDRPRYTFTALKLAPD